MHCAAYLYSTAVLVALAGASVVDPQSFYRRNISPKEFLEHVMMHQKDWALAMRELVRGPDSPPHGGPPGPADGDKDAVDVRPIVTEIAAGYSMFGTVVDYAVGLVLQALICFTYRHLTFQAHYVHRLFGLEVEPDVLHAELIALKNVAVQAADKLSLGPVDMQLLIELYWEVTKLIQYDVVHQVRRSRYPPRSGDKILELHNKFRGHVNRKCVAYELERKFFEDLGVTVDDVTVLDGVLGLAVEQVKLIRLGRDHASFLTRYYQNLRVETMSSKHWGEIFYHAESRSMKDELDETNPYVTPELVPVTSRHIPIQSEPEHTEPAESS